MKSYIQAAWGSKDPDKFPGPQPISIERRHFPILKSNEYLVCEKTDGERRMLVCFESEGKKVCLLVNRAFQFIYTTLTVPRDTVLDGELLDGEYIVHDAVRIKGEDVSGLKLTERLEKARKMCTGIIKTPGNPKVRVKKMIPLSQVGTLELGPKTDGLVFTPVNEPIRIGTHETLFKWKPRDRITIDFRVEIEGYADSRPIYGLFLQGMDSVVPLCRKDAKEFQGKIVECEYGDVGWKIVKVRTDKDYPNNRRTFDRTLVNLREDIKISEFNALIDGHP